MFWDPELTRNKGKRSVLTELRNWFLMILDWWPLNNITYILVSERTSAYTYKCMLIKYIGLLLYIIKYTGKKTQNVKDGEDILKYLSLDGFIRLIFQDTSFISNIRYESTWSTFYNYIFLWNLTRSLVFLHNICDSVLGKKKIV